MKTNFFGGVFFEEFFGEIFWEDFLGGIFWEEFSVYIVKFIWIWKDLIGLSRFCLNALLRIQNFESLKVRAKAHRT